MTSTEQVIFNSRDSFFKTPFGALPSGSEVFIRILIDKTTVFDELNLVIKYDRHDIPAYYRLERQLHTEETDYIEYFTKFNIHDTGLYWYHFELLKNGEIRYVGVDESHKACFQQTPNDWQITVYNRIYNEPSWLHGGVFYHIFVDRFYKGKNETLEKQLRENKVSLLRLDEKSPLKNPFEFQNSGDSKKEIKSKIIRDDWGQLPIWQKEDGEIYNRDFFCGNLQGIIDKLPYLNDLGVTCLYLSPIFESYSNHKYDTGDYSKIDSMFGNEEDFKNLCDKAATLGISVICDGVFSHTGSDSIYFNKYGNYESKGAWNNLDSPYRSWYYFHESNSYESWWGISTLPRINKANPQYTDFVCGENGIVRKWLKLGARGWRLDVADELDTPFLEKLVSAAKEEKKDSVIIGEVWEDASNKIAYNERKNYFEGDKLDSVMNYPFRTGIIDFVRNGNAKSLSNIVESIMENYPPQIINSLMNLVGTHDSIRILTALAGEKLLDDTERDIQATTRLSDSQLEHGLKLMKIASAIQFTLPGVPCIYYGDEVQMEGYKDPFNRQCFPWGHENTDLLNWYRKVISIRKTNEVYKHCGYQTLNNSKGLFAFKRFNNDSPESRTEIITCANCGKETNYMDLQNKMTDLITGECKIGRTPIKPYEVMILSNNCK